MAIYTTTVLAPGYDDQTLYKGDDLETAVTIAHEWLGDGRRISNVKIQALYQAPTFITFSYGEHPDEYIRIEAAS